MSKFFVDNVKANDDEFLVLVCVVFPSNTDLYLKCCILLSAP